MPEDHRSSPALAADRLGAIDAAARRAIGDGRTPGLTLAVVDRDGPLAVRTYGFADVAARAPVEQATLFEIGSIGKTFTAVAVLQVVEEGRLDLQAPVDAYLPWFTVPRLPGAGPITVHHLLSHTAGIVSGVDGTPEAAFQVWSLRELEPGSAPGERFHYSDVGYKALGLLLERVEGQPYPDVIRRRILEPLGMDATEPAITHAVRPRLAVGYENLDDDRIGHAARALAPAAFLETDTADGSIASTASDMGVFLRMLLRGGEGPRGRLLGEASFAMLRAPHVLSEPGLAYGYGLWRRTIGERTFIGHGGGMVGYLAGMQADPDSGLGAIVLQNGPGARPMALAREVIGIAAGWPPASEAAADGASAGDVASPGDGDLVGRWVRDDGSASFTITAHDDELRLETDLGAVVIERRDADRFLVPDPVFDDALLRLMRPPDAAPELWHGGERYTRGGSTFRPLPPAPPELLPCPGRYRSHNPWCPVFQVVLRGDRLWLLVPAAPDGFDDEQPLVPLPDGSFRAGEDPGCPERVHFDTAVEGRSLRAWLSGWPYYRVGT